MKRSAHHAAPRDEQVVWPGQQPGERGVTRDDIGAIHWVASALHDVFRCPNKHPLSLRGGMPASFKRSQTHDNGKPIKNR